MNLILIKPDDFIEPDRRVRLGGRRARHIHDIHRAEPGQELRIGLLGGDLGLGRVVSLDANEVELELSWMEVPPPPSPLTLVLALPRPKFLKRILTAVTTLGIKRIYLINSLRVEKSYWHCEQIRPESIHDACLKGLEQARDTILPRIELRRRFRPFVEDELPELITNSRAVLAHPGAAHACPANLAGDITLAVGPEGGFIPFEIELFQQAGFEAVSLGPRVLSVETALPALLGRLGCITPS